MAVVARRCAEASGTVFVGDALSKEAHKPLHTVSDAYERQEILDEATFRSEPVGADSVVVFDDLITRGDTLSHIARAILTANRSVKVYGVALGKTERRSFQQDVYGIEISNDHVPKKWKKAWQAGQARWRARGGGQT